MTQPQKSRPKVSISEQPLLVDIGKSKKLSALATKSTAALPDKPCLNAAKLVSESDATLQLARTLLDKRVQDMLHSFPQGRCNKLFALRFGSVEKIQALELKVAFQLLDLHAPQLNWRLLAQRNYHGESI